MNSNKTSIISNLGYGLFVCVILFCWSCNHKTKYNNNIFRYNESAGISTLDPAFAKNQALMWPVHQLYNTLVEINDKAEISPSLAQRWTFSADKKSVVFHLRNDVYFHEDPCFLKTQKRNLVAGDVVYSLSRIINPLVASPGAWIFNNIIDSALPFVALNDTTFQLNLKHPYSPILGVLTMQYCSIIPKEAVDFYGVDFRMHPVGTGPFQFLAWKEGQALILKKNTNYFEKDVNGKRLPYLDGVAISFLNSKTSEFLEFQQSKIDFINDIDASCKDELLNRNGSLKSDWKQTINVEKNPYLNIEYLGILSDTAIEIMKSSPLKFKKIRQAISYGIDRKKMLFYMRNSIGIPATSGFIPAGLPSFDSVMLKGYDYNPAKAIRLLEEAGFNESNSLPEIKLYTVPNYANLATFISNELKQVGIKLTIEVVQKSLLLEQMSKSQISFFRGSWIADYPDEINFLGLFYSKNPAPPNYTRFVNNEYDRLFELAMIENNDSLKFDMFQKMQQIIIEESPVIPLWYDMSLRLYHKNLKGFKSNALNMLELRRVVKE
jgi:peptide/nickel transport system substrate-binding protein